MANYPYTYLASFMNNDFRATVVSTAVRDIGKAPGSLRQRLDRAVRSAGVQAPGYRPGKIPLNQVAKPLVMPVSRTSQVTPFTSSEEIAATIFSLWLDARSELRDRVAAFLQGKGLPHSEELPAGGLPGTMKASEMEALAGEMGASSETDSVVYDDTALMLVLLLGRAPVPDEEAEEEQPAPGEQVAGQPEAEGTAATPPLPGSEAAEPGERTEEAPGPDVAGVA